MWKDGQCFYCGALTLVKKVRGAAWTMFKQVYACKKHAKHPPTGELQLV